MFMVNYFYLKTILLKLLVVLTKFKLLKTDI